MWSKLAKLGLVSLAMTVLPQTAFANCNGDQACLAWRAANAQPVNIDAFAAGSEITTGTISNVRIPGLAADEKLCPVKCPVNVLNPEKGEVKDCYNICKEVTPAPAAVPMPAPTPVTAQRLVYQSPIFVPAPQIVRVVRPIVYVQAPILIQAPVYAAPCYVQCGVQLYGH